MDSGCLTAGVHEVGLEACDVAVVRGLLDRHGPEGDVVLAGLHRDRSVRELKPLTLLAGLSGSAVLPARLLVRGFRLALRAGHRFQESGIGFLSCRGEYCSRDDHSSDQKYELSSHEI